MYTSGIFLVLLLNVGSAAADLGNGGLCYILDGILVIYGIILTILYCRLRMRGNSGSPAEEKQGEGIYQGLKPHAQDTYETLNVNKRKALA
ncbi:Fc receptor, IgE, high affinity I, gamma polypeptide like [Colossoma macropomum]|uniref:Fc receptor, IgE, high affinity I, gamma polypeptide like n=1 Tax=Colossoma macropomum TaxID=42526 RepID=UPI0018647CD8|nr:Fc receptor, IgE, high affinity I, gamma polypeptide like [Colossoma macropomum]